MKPPQGGPAGNNLAESTPSRIFPRAFTLWRSSWLFLWKNAEKIKGDSKMIKVLLLAIYSQIELPIGPSLIRYSTLILGICCKWGAHYRPKLIATIFPHTHSCITRFRNKSGSKTDHENICLWRSPQWSLLSSLHPTKVNLWLRCKGFM